MADYPFEMELQRTADAKNRDRRGKPLTFSAEALDGLGKEFSLMIARACQADWEATGKPPVGLKVMGTVIIPDP